MNPAKSQRDVSAAQYLNGFATVGPQQSLSCTDQFTCRVSNKALCTDHSTCNVSIKPACIDQLNCWLAGCVGEPQTNRLSDWLQRTATETAVVRQQTAAVQGDVGALGGAVVGCLERCTAAAQPPASASGSGAALSYLPASLRLSQPFNFNPIGNAAMVCPPALDGACVILLRCNVFASAPLRLWPCCRHEHQAFLD
jgi:hypothetical protein